MVSHADAAAGVMSAASRVGREAAPRFSRECGGVVALRDEVAHEQRRRQTGRDDGRGRHRGRRLRSMVFKLALFVAALLMTTAGVTNVVGYLVARRIVRDEIDHRLQAAALHRHKIVEAYVHRQHERIALIASRTQLRRTHPRLRWQREHRRGVSASGRADSAGRQASQVDFVAIGGYGPRRRGDCLHRRESLRLRLLARR